LKAKKSEIKVSELFRQKLEGCEVVPDVSVRNELMRKLEFQEFFRFNPLRLNIWYVALLTIIVITGLLLLMQVEPKPEQVSDGVIGQGNEITINQQPGITESVNPKMTAPVSANSAPLEISKTQANTIAANPEKREERTVNPTSVSAASADNGLNELRKSEISSLIKAPVSGLKLFESSSTSGCLPLKLKFLNKSVSCDSCRWTFGDGGFSTETNPEWIYDSEGQYRVELTVFCPERPPETSFTIITVYPVPVARFEISAENTAIPGDQIKFINFSSGASGFKWNFGDGKESDSFEPWHSYSKQGNYNVSLVAVSDKGCSDSVKIDNVLSGSEHFIQFPNAFIPNQLGPSGGFYSARSDESSVVFHPVFSGVTEYQLKIFSKTGILIFESNDINIGWDGYVDGLLSAAGVYIWKVRGKFRNGETFTKMGDVTLIKAASN
jgi:PKD repeat protein